MDKLDEASNMIDAMILKEPGNKIFYQQKGDLFSLKKELHYN
jgi:hypothetical protein